MIIDDENGRLAAEGGKIAFEASALRGKSVVGEVVFVLAMAAAGDACGIDGKEVKEFAVVIAVGTTGVVTIKSAVESAVAHNDTCLVVDAQGDGILHFASGECDDAAGSLIVLEVEMRGLAHVDATEDVGGYSREGSTDGLVQMDGVVKAQIGRMAAILVLDGAAGG